MLPAQQREKLVPAHSESNPSASPQRAPELWRWHLSITTAGTRALVLAPQHHPSWHPSSSTGPGFAGLPEPRHASHRLPSLLCKRCYLFTSSLSVCLASQQSNLFSAPASMCPFKPPFSVRMRPHRWKYVTRRKTFISVERVAGASGDASHAVRKKDAKCCSLKPVAEADWG